MEQYMEASQTLLGRAQSGSWGSPEEGQGRQIGGTAGQRLDDVVVVKVGRSVRSVYDDEDDRSQEAAGVSCLYSCTQNTAGTA